jgi:hypothetical protein
VPGSCGFIIEVEGRTLVVSGDFTFPDHTDREPWPRVAAAFPGGIDLFLCDGTGLTRALVGTKEDDLPAAILPVFQETAGDVWATVSAAIGNGSACCARLRWLPDAVCSIWGAPWRAPLRPRSVSRGRDRRLSANRARWPSGPKLVLVAGTQGEGESAFPVSPAARPGPTGGCHPLQRRTRSGQRIGGQGALDRFAASTATSVRRRFFPSMRAGMLPVRSCGIPWRS